MVSAIGLRRQFAEQRRKTRNMDETRGEGSGFDPRGEGEQEGRAA